VSAPRNSGFTSTEPEKEAAGSPASDETRPDPGQSGLVAGIQQRQAEYAKLLELCRSLRAARPHRCPGRCVLRGELGHDGLAVFRSVLDGSA
jgi:hypothetical protein